MPLGGSLVDTKGVSGVVQLTSSLSPSVVNVARASYAYMTLFGKQVTVDRDIAKEIGITGVSTSHLNWGVPGVAFQGFSGIGSNGLTQGNVLHNYQITDNLTWIRGAHTFKDGLRHPPNAVSCWTATTVLAAASLSMQVTPPN